MAFFSRRSYIRACTVADKADFQANDSKMSGSEHKVFFTKQYINPRIHDGVGDSSRTTKSSMKPLWLIKRVTCPNMIIWIKKGKVLIITTVAKIKIYCKNNIIPWLEPNRRRKPRQSPAKELQYRCRFSSSFFLMYPCLW